MINLPKYRQCIQSEYHAIDRDGNKVPIKEILDDLEAAKKMIKHLQDASYSLVISMFHSGKYDEYTGKEFREMLVRCGFVENDLVFPNKKDDKNESHD